MATPPKRTAPLSPRPYGGVAGALANAKDLDPPVNGRGSDVPSFSGPAEVDAGGPAPPRDPGHGVDVPPPAAVREQRLINPEGLTRRFDEAERRIRRQVTQQMERGIRVVPPVNISALEQGGYTTTSGSRVGYDLKRFAGKNPQGGEMGGNKTARGGGRAPSLQQATRMGGPVDPSGRDLLNRYTESPGVDTSRSGMGARTSGGANPQGLIKSAQRLSRGRR